MIKQKDILDFIDNILLVDSIIENKIEYNMIVNYFKNNNKYNLGINIYQNDTELISSKYLIETKKEGSIVISELINIITKKYNNTLIIDIKELNEYKKCIKFGRRVYNGNK